MTGRFVTFVSPRMPCSVKQLNPLAKAASAVCHIVRVSSRLAGFRDSGFGFRTSTRSSEQVQLAQPFDAPPVAVFASNEIRHVQLVSLTWAGKVLGGNMRDSRKNRTSPTLKFETPVQTSCPPCRARSESAKVADSTPGRDPARTPSEQQPSPP